jgi:hypothetical protein
MQPRFEIATVLCFTVALLAGCAFGLRKAENGALGKGASRADAGTLITQETAGAQENLARQPEAVGQLKRAAALHEYGRYYK